MIFEKLYTDVCQASNKIGLTLPSSGAVASATTSLEATSGVTGVGGEVFALTALGSRLVPFAAVLSETFRLPLPTPRLHQIVRTRPHPRFLELHLAFEHRAEVRHARRDHVETAGRKTSSRDLSKVSPTPDQYVPDNTVTARSSGWVCGRQAVPRLRPHPERVRPRLRRFAVDAGVEHVGRCAPPFPGDVGRQQPAQAFFGKRNPARSAQRGNQDKCS